MMHWMKAGWGGGVGEVSLLVPPYLTLTHPQLPPSPLSLAPPAVLAPPLVTPPPSLPPQHHT